MFQSQPENFLPGRFQLPVHGVKHKLPAPMQKRQKNRIAHIGRHQTAFRYLRVFTLQTDQRKFNRLPAGSRIALILFSILIHLCKMKLCGFTALLRHRRIHFKDTSNLHILSPSAHVLARQLFPQLSIGPQQFVVTHKESRRPHLHTDQFFLL